MEHPYYKSQLSMSQLGIQLNFRTTPGGYHPLHWHEELEILYPLNGETDLTVEGMVLQVISRLIRSFKELYGCTPFSVRKNRGTDADIK